MHWLPHLQICGATLASDHNPMLTPVYLTHILRVHPKKINGEGGWKSWNYIKVVERKGLIMLIRYWRTDKKKNLINYVDFVMLQLAYCEIEN